LVRRTFWGGFREAPHNLTAQIRCEMVITNYFIGNKSIVLCAFIDQIKVAYESICQKPIVHH
jgi:hypothetical protein